MDTMNWKEVEGDKTLALDWPIDKDALVFEIGGYQGRWAAQMADKYDPYIHIFEPQIFLFHQLLERFEGNQKIEIHPFGLWTHDTTLYLWEHDTDGASVVRTEGRTSQLCEFKDAVRYADAVDVCLMNIEGGEFVLLPYLLGLGLMDHFRFFWCQFHPGSVVLSEKKVKRIYAGMERTHKILWDFFPTAVAWERR